MPVPRLCNAAMTPDGDRLLCLFYLDYPVSIRGRRRRMVP